MDLKRISEYARITPLSEEGVKELLKFKNAVMGGNPITEFYLSIAFDKKLKRELVKSNPELAQRIFCVFEEKFE